MFGFSLHPYALLRRYSGSYNAWVDRSNFEQLREDLIADDIYDISVYKRSEDPERASTFVVVADRGVLDMFFNMFNDVIYVESAWNMESINNGMYSIRVRTEIEGGLRGREFWLSDTGAGQFLVGYNDRGFIVEISGLLLFMQSVFGDENDEIEGYEVRSYEFDRT